MTLLKCDYLLCNASLLEVVYFFFIKSISENCFELTEKSVDYNLLIFLLNFFLTSDISF